jgi:hypothetical protein
LSRHIACRQHFQRSTPAKTNEARMSQLGNCSDGTDPERYGASRLAVRYEPIMALRLDPQNPRLHSRKQVLQIANSIASFGFNVPVLIDAEQSVIAGHGRVLAAKQLGWTEVPVIAIEHLDAAQRRALAIGLGEWQHDNVPTRKSSLLRRARRRIRTTKRTIASSQRPSEDRFSVTRLAYAQSP